MRELTRHEILFILKTGEFHVVRDDDDIDWTCDSCGRGIAAGEILVGIRRYNVDVCVECIQSVCFRPDRLAVSLMRFKK